MRSIRFQQLKNENVCEILNTPENFSGRGRRKEKVVLKSDFLVRKAPRKAEIHRHLVKSFRPTKNQNFSYDELNWLRFVLKTGKGFHLSAITIWFHCSHSSALHNLSSNTRVQWIKPFRKKDQAPYRYYVISEKHRKKRERFCYAYFSYRDYCHYWKVSVNGVCK